MMLWSLRQAVNITFASMVVKLATCTISESKHGGQPLNGLLLIIMMMIIIIIIIIANEPAERRRSAGEAAENSAARRMLYAEKFSNDV